LIDLLIFISGSFKLGGFNIPANINLDIVQSPEDILPVFLSFAFGVVCRNYILRTAVKILFCLVPIIVFWFRANPIFYLGVIRCWKWNGINIKIPNWRLNVHRRTPSFGMDRNCTVYWCKYLVALNPGLGGVGSNVHFHYCPWTGSIKPSLQYFIYVMFGGFQSSLCIYYCVNNFQTNNVVMRELHSFSVVKVCILQIHHPFSCNLY
jgi:hypothetical protein